MRIIIYIALIIAVVIPLFAQSGVTDISLEELTDGSGLVRICYRARDMFDSTLAVNVQARWADSITWHIPVLTLFDTLSGYAMPNFGWRVNVDSIGLDHCFLWDMTTDLGSVEAKGFVARIVTFDSIVSRFNVVDSFQVSDSLRPELRAFGLGYRRGQLWVLYHNESTHDCWVRPYSLPELIEGDSLYIGTVTVGPSDMAFAGDRLFWVEDTRLLLKEFDFSTGTSRTVRGDWWGLPYTSTHIAGCAFDGQNLWVCFAEGAFVSLDTSDFSLVDTMFFSDFSTATPSTSADGLAWGLGLLWCYSNDNKVYAIDVETDSIIVSIPTGDVVLETGAEGAAWDGMNLWVVDYARGHVYKLLLYNQISIYISDNFILDNVPPTIEWLNPSLPDYSDSFITDDTSEISWSVRDSNLYGGTSVLLIDTDTLSEFPSVEMSFLWPTNPWPAYHGNFTIFITDSFGNNTSSTSPEFVIVPPAGISETILPSDFLLSAYPNPFNSAVTISYDCSVGEGLAPSRVEIFDFAGRMVAQLPSPSVPLSKGEGGDSFSLWEKVAEGRMRAEFIWRPSPAVTSGVYLVRAKFGGQSLTKRLVYLK